MTDIAASERRLGAALDRIDFLLERGILRPDPVRSGDDAAALQSQLDTALIENERLMDMLTAAAPIPTDPAPDLTPALHAAEDRAIRLAAANDDLMAANAALIASQAGQGDGADATHAALVAQIAALCAARAAEGAQIGDIMSDLQRLMAQGTATDHATTPQQNG